MARRLESQLVPAGGLLLEYCRFVGYGFFGNLEVLWYTIGVVKADKEVNWKWASGRAKLIQMRFSCLHASDRYFLDEALFAAC